MLEEGDDVIEGTAAIDNAVDLAATHTQAQAQRYGVRADIIRNLTDESLQVFGSICSRWHDFLGLGNRQPTWMKHSRGPSDSAMETPVKRAAGLTLRPYSTPANRPVMGSQSTDTSMGGSIGAREPGYKLARLANPSKSVEPRQPAGSHSHSSGRG
jgi:hypothetical protein